MDIGCDKVASPQLENGYTPIANELLEAVYLADLNATQLKIVLFIMRYTYGFSRKQHTLSVSFIANGTGISRRRVTSGLQSLIDNNIVRIIKDQTGTRARILQINKHYKEWNNYNSCQLVVTVPSPDGVVTPDAPVTTRGDAPVTSRGDGSVTQDKQKTKYKTSIGGGVTTASPLAKKKTPSPVKVAIDYYHDKFKSRFGEKPIISGKKDGNLIKQVVSKYGIKKTKELLDKFFEVDDKFIQQSGYTIGVFYTQVNKLLTLQAGKTPRYGRL